MWYTKRCYPVTDGENIKHVPSLHAEEMSYINLVIHDHCNWNDNTYINANDTRMTKMPTDFLAMTPKDVED